MKRFFINKESLSADTVVLSREESWHVSKVLRLVTGDPIELYDGSGTVYSAEISRIGDLVTAQINGIIEPVDTHFGRILVGQGVIKAKKMEMILQKATELGVTAVVPFFSVRSQRNIAEQYKGKRKRWGKIIEESCKQTQRPKPMELYDLSDFDAVLRFTDNKRKFHKLLFWEKEEKVSLSAYEKNFTKESDVMLLFGPEGGFTPEEILQARDCGWQTVGLGEQILRAETAVIAAVSIVNYLCGRM